MPRNHRTSRLNPFYLLAYHGGALFLFLASGIAAGTLYRALVESVDYSVSAGAQFVVDGPESVDAFNLEDRLTEWAGLARDERIAPLLENNLRHAVKLAAVPYTQPSRTRLMTEIAGFTPERTYDSILGTALARHVSPTLRVARRDIAANLDYQSLAVIVSDLDPPADAPSWDFSFFPDGMTSDPFACVITSPGPDDPFFRVFYHLYSIRHTERVAASPREAWLAAVDELAERLAREAEFAGGGGFGQKAARELMREFAAIPILAANGLYHRVDGGETDQESWRSAISARLNRAAGTSVSGRMNDAATGSVTVSVNARLNPVLFVRDTYVTRIQPIQALSELSFIIADELRREPGGGETKTQPAPPPAPPRVESAAPAPGPVAEHAAEAQADEPAAVPGRTEAEYRAELEAWRFRIQTLEDDIRQAMLERAAVCRQRDDTRAGAERLAAEALTVRARADRLRERYEGMVAEEEFVSASQASVEAAALILARDEVRQRLLVLLETCTEEHPFVREARRELNAVEALLAKSDPDAAMQATAKMRDNLRRSIYLEWEAADAAAEALQERRRRAEAEIRAVLDKITELESVEARLQAELARWKLEEPAPYVPLPAARPKRQEPAPAEAVPAPPLPTVQSTSPAEPVLVFSSPVLKNLNRRPPPWTAVVIGVIAGCCLGLAWVLLSEAATTRFRDTRVARAMVDLPLLAALPGYEPSSFKAAFRAIKGNPTPTKGGRIVFAPLPVDIVEPAAAGKRKAIKPLRRRRRFLAWLCGLCLLALAFVVAARPKQIVPEAYRESASHLAPPAAADCHHCLEGDPDSSRDWENMP